MVDLLGRWRLKATESYSNSNIAARKLPYHQGTRMLCSETACCQCVRCFHIKILAKDCFKKIDPEHKIHRPYFAGSE